MRLASSIIIFLLLFQNFALAETIFERKISFGGQLASGNTDVQSLHADFSLNRNRKFVDEITAKGSFDREFSSGAETQLKAYSSLRLAHSLSNDYYRYYKLEAFSDRFQDIDMRLIPTVGLGYWFINEKDFKSMIEAAVGYQKEYLINKTAEEMFVLTLSHNLLFGVFSNDLDVYTAINDLDNYRFINIAKMKIKLNTHYAFKLSLKDEFNNRPAAGVQKNDVTFITSLEYAFKETRK
ncbi:MAG: DUF481 domain-containing protein [Candidatus Margulisiibacteriota bacterium]